MMEKERSACWRDNKGMFGRGLPRGWSEGKEGIRNCGCFWLV